MTSTGATACKASSRTGPSCCWSASHSTVMLCTTLPFTLNTGCVSRYNLKRKVAGLPPVTRVWFEQRREQLGSAAGAGAKRVWFDPLTKKRFQSKSTYEAHVSSRKYQDLVKKSGQPAPQPVVTFVNKQAPGTVLQLAQIPCSWCHGTALTRCGSAGPADREPASAAPNTFLPPQEAQPSDKQVSGAALVDASRWACAKAAAAVQEASKAGASVAEAHAEGADEDASTQSEVSGWETASDDDADVTRSAGVLPQRDHCRVADGRDRPRVSACVTSVQCSRAAATSAERWRLCQGMRAPRLVQPPRSKGMAGQWR